jgi:hypothetical protein
MLGRGMNEPSREPLALEGDEHRLGRTERPKDTGNACVYLIDD